MRIVVIGAGVIGVTTAYELARAGHHVTVVERHPEPASGTSYANAGLIAPGHAYTWASPKAPMTLFRSLYRSDQALRFKPSLDRHLWSWSFKFLRNCTAERAMLNTKRKVRLCRYSQERLHQISSETGVRFDGQDGGLLYLFRTEQSFRKGAGNTKILADEGLSLRAIDMDEAAKIDPALAAVSNQFAGAVYCPSDESGDARLFTRNLSAYCRDNLGVDFMYDTDVTGFEASGDEAVSVRYSGGAVAADFFVLCTGVDAPKLAKSLKLSLPVYPVKGYSVTFPIGGRNNVPSIGGVDEDKLVAYARFGDRFRVTATAEFAGFDRRHKPSDFGPMIASIRSVFPDAADYGQPEYWAGLRPMTPEGTPIFGSGRLRNVLLNVGHGHMGWTMAAGSARIAADLVAGRTPEIDLAGMLLPA